jgi:hypothetical protein
MWFGKPGEIEYGAKSVHYIIDRCKQFGWKRLYWRCFDGGLAHFKSKLMEPASVGYSADNYSAWAGYWDAAKMAKISKAYETFDELAEAVRYGHQAGVEVHAWLTINEDDHGWGIMSKFSREHPEYRWVKRFLLPYNSQLSFGFEAVREYKLGLLKEILAYDIDGVFFDWIRTGDLRNEPQATPDGTADFGYEKPLVEEFEKKYSIKPTEVPNDDERWVRLRAAPQTEFMRLAHDLIKAKDHSLPISVMGQHPWSFRGETPRINGNLNGLLLDFHEWAREGWIDAAVPAGYYTKGATPEMAYAYMKDLVGKYCPIWLFTWVPPDTAQFHEGLELAQKLGARQILQWESNYIDLPKWQHDPQLGTEMRNYADGKS